MSITSASEKRPMLDPKPDPAAGPGPDDPNGPQSGELARQMLRDMFPVIMLGFVLVVIGLFVFLWPTGAWGAEGTITVPHLKRLLGTGLPESGITVTRRIL